MIIDCHGHYTTAPKALQAYRDSLNGRTTSFVLTPDSGFFRFFENLDGTAAKPTQPGPTAGAAAGSR